MDGCHIHIKASLETQADYIDRTQRHSVNHMAVCTPDKRFSFIHAGFPGSAHDSRVFRSCSLYNKMEECNCGKYLPQEYMGCEITSVKYGIGNLRET